MAFRKSRTGSDSGWLDGVRLREYGREERRRVAEEELDVRGTELDQTGVEELSLVWEDGDGVRDVGRECDGESVAAAEC